MPSGEQYFQAFADLAAMLTRSASLLAQLFSEPHRAVDLGREIGEAERAADDATHRVNRLLHGSFFTPFDRADIHRVAVRIHDVVRRVDGIARRVSTFGITEVPPGARRLSEVLLHAAERIEGAVGHLRSPKALSLDVRTIKQLEEEADALYTDAVGTLFTNAPDALAVIKWKDLYDRLEDATDSCAHLAQMLAGVSLKQG